jgi:hypothetical protein
MQLRSGGLQVEPPLVAHCMIRCCVGASRGPTLLQLLRTENYQLPLLKFRVVVLTPMPGGSPVRHSARKCVFFFSSRGQAITGSCRKRLGSDWSHEGRTNRSKFDWNGNFVPWRHICLLKLAGVCLFCLVDLALPFCMRNNLS